MAEEENGDDGDEKVGEVLLSSLARGARRPELDRNDGGGGDGHDGDGDETGGDCDGVVMVSKVADMKTQPECLISDRVDDAEVERKEKKERSQHCDKDFHILLVHLRDFFQIGCTEASVQDRKLVLYVAFFFFLASKSNVIP